jgi:rhomboid protease GluP
MCPNCRAFITTDDKVCPYCEAPVGPRAIDHRAPDAILGGLIPQAHFTTVVILLINFGLFVATYLYANTLVGPGAQTRSLLDFGAKYGPYIEAGQWWRLITAGFLHGSVLHILMNSWALFDLGAQVEEAYGTARYLVLYILTTIAGFYVSMWWNPQVPSVGSSAGIFGLIGAMIALGIRHRSYLGDAVRQFYIRWAVYGFALGILFPGTDNGAHFGGVVSGFVLAYIMGTPRVVGMQEKVWRLASILVMLITVAAFALMILSFLRVSR